MESMFYVLMELTHGDALGEFDSLEKAEAALDRVLAVDPAAASELGIVAYDETGERHGESPSRAQQPDPALSGHILGAAQTRGR
jgi:hypothetical protein